MSTLHPVVDLRIGGRLYNVPPQYLQELTEIDRFGYYTATLKLIDPTFSDLEVMLVEAMHSKETSTIEYRWGYPESNRYTDWRSMVPLQITPDISTSGYTLTIQGAPTIASYLVLRENQILSRGKISDCVSNLAFKINRKAQRTGLRTLNNIYIEPTSDDYNEEKLWSSGTSRSIPQFIQDVFCPRAKSKENPGKPYFFKIDPLGNFHFHTHDYAGIVGLQYRKFTYLFGTPGVVLRFTPDYHSRILAMGAGGWVGSTFDPKSKQIQIQAINRNTVSADSEYDRTIAAPPNELDPEATDVSELYFHEPSIAEDSISTGTGGVQSTFDYIENRWKLLTNTIQGATLEILGTPETMDFSASEMRCSVHVVLPDRGGEQLNERRAVNPRLHWTSGMYDIYEVTHTITGSYTISVNLGRATSLYGPTPTKAVR